MSGPNDLNMDGNRTGAEPAKSSKRGFWKRAKDPKAMVFSHHPPCNKYRTHTFQIRYYNFCIGCFIGYPAAVGGIILSTWLYLSQSISLFLLLGIGILCYLTFLLSFSKYSEIKWVKIAQKFAIGLGSGFILVFIFFIFEVWIIFKIIIGFGFFVALLQPIRTFHKAKLIAVCNACQVKDTDPNCIEKQKK